MIITRDGVSVVEARRLVDKYLAGKFHPTRTGLFADRGACEPELQVECLGEGIFHVSRCDQEPPHSWIAARPLVDGRYAIDMPMWGDIGTTITVSVDAEEVWTTTVLDKGWFGLTLTVDPDNRPSLWKLRERHINDLDNDLF